MSTAWRREPAEPVEQSLLSPTDPDGREIVYLAHEEMIPTRSSVMTQSPVVRGCGAAAFQNKQIKASMEDECVLVPSLRGPHGEPGAFFGVYDGHGGGFVSKYLATTLHVAVQKRVDDGMPVATALGDAFASIDMGLEEMEEADACGSTAVVCVVLPTEIFVANIGDSHCLLFNGSRLQRLSADHHVRNDAEINRIKDNQGIILNHRVSGVSRVTRAFGQNNEKDLIIPTPHLKCVARPSEASETPAFVVLVSDGVTDVLSDADIGRYVLRGLVELLWSPDRICRELLGICRLKRAFDNMTVVLVLL
ncbi:protein phosphatase 2C [Achlya hypogyna]|uniref:protein-serine/threonine phosphatase n=1 Tax=Achlya hypogyna TaxID=1202772 RepID=A0A1V9Z9L7_ACHHY|nr:protein phosphatase 2C [Achlya hypogyna]